MGMFRRRRPHRPVRPVIRIGVSTPDPVAEVATLRSMIGPMLSVRDTAQAQVDDLRTQLGRPTAARSTFPEPVPAPRANDVIGEAVALQSYYDRLYEQVDGLWFEKQWLGAELAVARRVGPPLITPRWTSAQGPASA